MLVSLGILPQHIDIDDLSRRRLVLRIVANRRSRFGADEQQPRVNVLSLAIDGNDRLMLFRPLGTGKHF